MTSKVIFTPEEALQLDLAQTHAQFVQQEAWEQRYRLVLQLAKQLPALPPPAKCEENRIAACESNVWLVHQAFDQKHYFYADSDARIVKGLLAIITGLANGKTAAELTQLDFQNLLHTLKLHKHLSESRSNGIKAVLATMQNLWSTTP